MFARLLSSKNVNCMRIKNDWKKNNDVALRRLQFTMTGQLYLGSYPQTNSTQIIAPRTISIIQDGNHTEGNCAGDII